MTDKQKEEEHINSMADNIVLGLERTLEELGTKLVEQVDGLTAKQIKKAVKAHVTFTATKVDTSDASSMTEREKKFLAGLMALQESSLNYTIHVLGQLQKEQDEKQNKKSTEPKGEDNGNV